jgi:hypothetical protein
MTGSAKQSIVSAHTEAEWHLVSSRRKTGPITLDVSCSASKRTQLCRPQALVVMGPGSSPGRRGWFFDSNFKQLSDVIVRGKRTIQYSEASRRKLRGCGLLDARLRGHDGGVRGICVRILAAQSTRVLRHFPPSSKTEGAGKAGCRLHPWVPCNKKHGGRTTGSTGNTPAFPARWFTAYFVLSPVTGLSCHRHPRDTSRALSASVGARGPHDFAVRKQSRSSFATLASTASHRNVRDDRDPPLIRVRRAELKH